MVDARLCSHADADRLRGAVFGLRLGFEEFRRVR
jgi:hypothetical protein